MKKVILSVFLVTLLAGVAFTQSIENQIREFAAREYPNDPRMQQYVYDKQSSAYRYMLTVDDADVKPIAVREYPNDYALQKYTYDKQLSAKRYLVTVADQEVKRISRNEQLKLLKKGSFDFWVGKCYNIKKGHNYITLFVDLLKKRTIYIAQGKDGDTVKSFTNDQFAAFLNK